MKGLVSRLLFCCWLSVVLGSDPRGVNPAIVSHYHHEKFSCFDGNGLILQEEINDDFCDCVDGSDEPGTSACPAGIFYCQNIGFEPRQIPSYFVDDGICDCCDGSDESKITCQNSCIELGKKKREEYQHEIEQYQAALKEKAHRFQSAENLLKQWEGEIQTAKGELKEQQEVLDQLQEKLDALEAENQKQEAEKAAAGAKNSTNTTNSTAEEKDPGDNVEEKKGDYEEQEEEEEFEEDYSVQDDDLQTETEEGHRTSFFSSLWKRLTSLFQRSGEETEETELKHEPESDLAKVRKEHTKQKRQLNDLTKKVKKLEQKLVEDYGPNRSFISLVDKCFERNQDKYTYEICPFDKSKQKHLHHVVTLGSWSGFCEDYKCMEFTNGQRCGHGRNRQLSVFFICGLQDQVLTVVEPSVCEYSANFSTPIVCEESELQELTKRSQILESFQQGIKDEL